ASGNPKPKGRVMKAFLTCVGLALAGALFALHLSTSRVAAAASPPRASVTRASVRAAIDAAVERERARFGGRTAVPGVLIGVWDGAGGSYVRGFGYADIRTKRPMTA